MLLRFLLVSGNRSDFSYPLDFTVFQIKQDVLRNWPSGKYLYILQLVVEWSGEERPDRFEMIRILYQGRFLEDGVALKSKDEY